MLRHASRRTCLPLECLLLSTISSRALSVTAARSAIAAAKSSRNAENLSKHLVDIGKHLQRIKRYGGDDVSSIDVDLLKDTTDRIRAGLKRKDPVAAWRQWTKLKERNMLGLVAPHQLNEFSQFIALACPLDSPDVEWASENRVPLEEMALVAAANNAPHGLNACMIRHLQLGDCEAVLRLYSRYLTLKDSLHGRDEGLTDERLEPLDAQGVLAPIENKAGPAQRVPALLVLPMIGVYAINNSLEDAFRIAQYRAVRRHHPSTEEFLNHFRNQLKKKLSTYIQRVENADLISRPASLLRQISNLSGNGKGTALQKFYDQIVTDGLLGADPYIAAHETMVSAQRFVTLPVGCWPWFLLAFMKTNQRERASRVWDDLVTAGLQPGPRMWIALLNGYDHLRAADDALDAWNKMIVKIPRPGPGAYRALISVLFKSRQSDLAMKYFAAFEKWLKTLGDSTEAEGELEVYNTALHGLLTDCRDPAASKVLEDMKKRGPKPDLVTYNTILQCYALRLDFKSVSQTLQELTKAGLTADVYTCTTILSALLKAGREDAVDVMTAYMENLNIKPNVATYSAIIDHLMGERTQSSLKAVFSLLQRMENTPGAEPNEVTYTSVLQGLYQSDWLNHDLMEECKRHVWDMMKNQGVPATRVIYLHVLQAALKNPTPSGLADAMSTYGGMLKTVGMDGSAWYVLLHGLWMREEWELGDGVTEQLFRSGFRPNSSLIDVIQRIRHRDALRKT